MRLQSLLALVATSALLLPLGAHADWAADKKGEYMAQCQQVATDNGLSASMAAQHCKCGADAIEKNFTKAEIEDLDSKDGVDAKLMQRAKSVVQTACTPKK